MLVALLLSLQAPERCVTSKKKKAAKETVLTRTSWTTYSFFQPVKGVQNGAVLSRTSYSLLTETNEMAKITW